MQEDKPAENLVPRFIRAHRGSFAYAVEVTGHGVTFGDNDNGVFIYVGRATDMFEINIYEAHASQAVDVSEMEPREPGMSLMDKLLLRFREAARRGTDVDLRFCTGLKAKRNPLHDNLRADYPTYKAGG